VFRNSNEAELSFLVWFWKRFESQVILDTFIDSHLVKTREKGRV
jgi:hypothetical protein